MVGHEGEGIYDSLAPLVVIIGATLTRQCDLNINSLTHIHLGSAPVLSRAITLGQTSQ